MTVTLNGTTYRLATLDGRIVAMAQDPRGGWRVSTDANAAKITAGFTTPAIAANDTPHALRLR